MAASSTFTSASPRASLCSGTGDLKNNMIKLLRELERMKIYAEPNVKSLSQGTPSAFLPILHSALMEYSLPLAKHIASMGIDLYSKNDLKFVNGLYKVMRDVFEYRPRLSRDQFLSDGFAERKIILSCDVLNHCQRMHLKLTGTSINSRPHTRGPKINSHSNISVHMLSDSSGISSYWEEKQTNTVSLSHREGHSIYVPLSPPQTPSLSPSTGKPTGTDPSLDVTPLQTPLKTSSSELPITAESCPHPREVTPVFAPLTLMREEPCPSVRDRLQLRVTGHGSGSKLYHDDPVNGELYPRETRLTTALEPLDKENLRPFPSNGSEDDSSRRGVEVLSTEASYIGSKGMHGLGGVTSVNHVHNAPSLPTSSDESSRKGKSFGADRSKNLEFPVSTDVNLITDKMDQLSRTVHTLSARIVLLETQLKMKDIQTTHIPVCHVSTQTDEQYNAVPVLSEKPQTLTEHTPSPVSSPILTPTHFTSPQGHNTDSMMSVLQTPEDTRQLIHNLRTRARTTKELLHRTHRTHSHNDNSF